MRALRCFLFLGLCLGVRAASISPVYISLGPNPFGSPSYAAYTANAQAAVAAGGINIGNINSSPTAYNTVTSISTADLEVDGNFPNWRGVANPAAPFNQQLGTAAFFSVMITGDRNDISLSDITYTLSDTDPVAPDYFANPLYGGTPAGSYAGSSYSLDHIGVLPNGNLVTSGPATRRVSQIILTSFSLAFDGSFYPGSGQQQLNNALADFNTLGAFKINVCFQDAKEGLNSCGNLSVTPTPEPGTFGFIGFVLAGLPLLLKRVRQS